MPKTIDSLVNDCNMDTLPSMPVIADYYGLQNFNEDNIPVILGIYQKMLKPQPFGFGIDKNDIEKAFLENKLDELIHGAYKKTESPDIIKYFVNVILKLIMNIYKYIKKIIIYKKIISYILLIK